VTASKIHLVFHLSDASVIDGTGPLPAAFETCPESLDGAFTGPKPGDTGDWLVIKQKVTENSVGQ